MALDASSLRTRDFRRILLIKLSALGDVVHTIPVLHKLRRRFPSARIDWLVRPAMADLIRHHPAVSNLVVFAREDWTPPWSAGLSTIGRLATLIGELRSPGYDLVVDLQGQLRSAMFALATGAPVRIGFDRPRREVWRASSRALPAEAYRHAWKGAREGSWIAYTDPIRLPTLDMHAVDRYLLLGPMIGLDRDPPDFSFPISPDAVAGADRLLREHGIPDENDRSRLAVLAPGTIWETKHWTQAGFAATARHCLAKGFRVVLIGSEHERPTCREVAAAAPGVVDLAGRTKLSELAALIRRAAICVTNDSGPMHLAVALDCPVVSVFGPTDPLWVGPYRHPESVLTAKLACSPCYLRELRRCPHGHACMHEVSAEAVIDRIDAILSSQPLGAARALARP